MRVLGISDGCQLYTGFGTQVCCVIVKISGKEVNLIEYSDYALKYLECNFGGFVIL